jgi:acetyltransferase-like isoleucine patch superfamily enzyme
MKKYIKENDIIVEDSISVTDIKNKLTNGNLLITKKSLNNKINIADNVVLKDVKIVLDGDNNSLTIEDGTQLCDCSFYAKGNNNSIFIGKECNLKGTYFMCMDNDNSIILNDNCTINGEFWGNVYFHTMEKTKIEIGYDCMLSGNITIRTTDGHSIINQKGERINIPQNINIGSHVWIGMNCTLLKGTNIEKGCIVGANSVVTKHFRGSYKIIAGNPAKVVNSKEEFDWKREKGFDFKSEDFRK